MQVVYSSFRELDCVDPRQIKLMNSLPCVSESKAHGSRVGVSNKRGQHDQNSLVKE